MNIAERFDPFQNPYLADPFREPVASQWWGQLTMHQCDSRGGSRTLIALLALALLCVLSVTTGAAEVMPVRFEGRVLWIAGTTLMVATDDSQSINVDLTHVPLDEYQGLRSNDYVVVVGTIPAERNRIVATSIEPLEP
jgi:hypothetical protein